MCVWPYVSHHVWDCFHSDECGFFGWLVLHGHEYTPGHFGNMTALCIASTLAWVWAFQQRKKPGTS